MIDPLRFVSTNRRINHFLVVIEPEVICLRIVEVFGNCRPQNAPAGILNDFLALSDRRRGKNAATVHRRTPDLQIFGSAIFGNGGASARSAFSCCWSCWHKMNSKFVRKAVAARSKETGAWRR